jgi:putative membrane protein (TIGR04086 family)
MLHKFTISMLVIPTLGGISVSKRIGKTRFNTTPKGPGTAMLIGKGVFVSIITSLVCTFFLSVISLVTENTYIDNYMQYVMVGVTMISIFIGSVYATQQAESRGLIIGVLIGLIYVLISVGIGMEISQESISLLVLANKFMAGIAVGILGGLIGVNL